MVEMFGHLYVGFSRSTPYAADSIIIIIIIIIITIVNTHNKYEATPDFP